MLLPGMDHKRVSGLEDMLIRAQIPVLTRVGRMVR
jgi:hypothetical protein